eukprot:CAMPEP_0118704190 /NCGR_PEP_ID=MMETSP0800-20121206/19071_1 /TAXON_ID=210618 ORGANISM="Striatella unipunctata, Strain CCMP2910" /NCGR_SAMPLE_ID=MMETSP0800 /ASSEMBLY_ACC=CAM_ASM_000638 /LENGTH=464 /DNA_ID=CAMNT_0006605999 /DNA_START=450 /DNA_END=1844 /DNA_ORIENTATION=+
MIENTECLSKQTLDSFISSIASLRSVHGVPVSLILCHLPVAPVLRIDHPRNENDGVMVKELFSPGAQTIFNDLIEQLVFESDIDSLPILLKPSTWKIINDNFELYDMSPSDAAQSIKKSIAFYFTQPGSFLIACSDPLYMKCHWQRLSSYCVDNRTRTHLMQGVEMSPSDLWQKIQDETLHRRCFSLLLEIFRFTGTQFYQHSSCEFLLDALLQPPDQKISEIAAFLLKGPRHEAMSKLGLLQEKLAEEVTFSRRQTPEQSFFDLYLTNNENEAIRTFIQLYCKLNELIILLHHHDSDTANTAAPREDITSMLEQWLHGWYELGTSAFRKNTLKGNKRIPFSTMQSQVLAEKCEAALTTEPRVSFSRAMYCPMDVVKGWVGEPGACEMMGLIKNVVHVKASEWFEQFSSGFNFVDDKTPTKKWDTFLFGIYQLIHCGVLRVRGRTKQDSPVFEKVTLVWCNYDA